MTKVRLEDLDEFPNQLTPKQEARYQECYQRKMNRLQSVIDSINRSELLERKDMDIIVY